VAALDDDWTGPGRDVEYVAAYCRRTGRERIVDWDFCLAYNMFRLAAILQGIAGRVVEGTAASAHAVETAAQARPIADQGWAIVQGMGAP
jgi:aminoglycoside phosphotransferase (APT) family kinase protein